jgi:hypothetical protein
VGAVNTRGGDAPQPVIRGVEELLTVTPAGRSSVMEKFVRSVSPGAKMSIRNLEFVPAGIVGRNDFIPVTSVPLMVRLAFAATKFPIP